MNSCITVRQHNAGLSPPMQQHHTAPRHCLLLLAARSTAWAAVALLLPLVGHALSLILLLPYQLL
jgi:hypothetical protein